MDKPRIGLVLAGGGGKGAYQIGVWKALKEYGIADRISGVSGTSVGALNALLFANGDLDVAERIWSSITQKDILTFDAKAAVKLMPLVFGGGFLPFSIGINIAITRMLKNGVFSPEGIEQLILRNIDFQRIAKLAMPVFAGAFALAGKRCKPGIRYLRMDGKDADTVKRIAMASSALPAIFPRQEIDRVSYMDGGVADNVPVKPLYDMGYRKIIVCHLDDDIKTGKLQKEYPDAELLEIVPQADQGGVISGLLDFTAEGAKRRMEQGYADMLRLLPQLTGLLQ